MTGTIVCTCISDGRGLIKVIDPFCKRSAVFASGFQTTHEELGTAVHDSPYDEVAKELLAGD